MVSNKKIVIDGETLPAQMGTDILERCLDASTLKAIWIAYKGSRKTLLGKKKAPPTELQLKIAARAKESKMDIKQLANEFNMTMYAIETALHKVAVAAFMNS